MKKMGKILPVEAVVGAAMLKNKGWLRGRICFENEVVYTVVRSHLFCPWEKYAFNFRCILCSISLAPGRL